MRALGSIVTDAAADEGVVIFDENAVQGGLVAKIHNFTRFIVQVISIPHQSQTRWLDVAQDSGVYIGSRFIVSKPLENVNGNLEV